MRENSWVMRWFLYIRENGAGKRKKRRRDVSLRKLDWTQHDDVTKTSCTMSRDSPISRYPVCKYTFFRNELLSMLEGSKRVGKRTRDANRIRNGNRELAELLPGKKFRQKGKEKRKEKRKERKEKEREAPCARSLSTAVSRGCREPQSPLSF